MVKSLRNKLYQERLQERNIYSLEERRERVNMSETIKCNKGVTTVQESSVQYDGKIKNIGHDLKLAEEKFKTN